MAKAESNFNKDLTEDSDDEIYEKIEAPKFVDFTRPDPLPSCDDRSWFCLRIGCDQQHEEIDPDALYRSFRLRVLAARSPNLRLQKALSKRAQSKNMKYPLSAPAKPSKPRVSRLMITSISRSLTNAKGKVSATPKVKAKNSSVAASKALTTPRYKRPIQNSDPFRSVRNPRKPSPLPKSRVVAKALVFNSPGKIEKKKSSAEHKTPATEICAGVEKLAISTQKKTTSGNYHHSLKHPAGNASWTSKSKTSALKPNGCKEASHSLKNQNSKSLTCTKKKSSKKLENCPVLKEVCNDSSDMEIDGKVMDGPFDVCLASDSSRSNELQENLLYQTDVQDANDSAEEECAPSSVMENAETASADASSSSNGRSSSFSNSEREENLTKDCPDSQISNGKGDQINKENGVEMNRIGVISEAIENDNKENARASDDNRNSNPNEGHDGRKVCETEAHGNHQKVIKALGKTFKGNSAAPSPFYGKKYKKPLPTNPKPFRLRTDERGILREANLEKKHCVAPLKEIISVPDEKYETRHVKEPIKKSQGVSGRENVACESSQKKSDKKVLKVDPVRGKITPSKTSKSRTKLEDQAVQEVEENKRANKSSSSQKLVGHQRTSGMRNGTGSLVSPSGSRLSVIKETVTASTPMNTKLEKKKCTLGSSNAASSNKSSPAQRRRPVTVPREPSFHKIHTPKSCTKTSANALLHNDS